MGIDYSLGNEDSRSEVLGLRLNKEDTVLCISGSGDRPLGLLSGPVPPAKMICIDQNPQQTDLLRLKLAALEGCPDPESFLQFMGTAPSTSAERADFYERYVRPRIDITQRDRLEKTVLPGCIRDGVALCGRLEQAAKVHAQALKALIGKTELGGILRSESQSEAAAAWAAQHPMTARFIRCCWRVGMWLSQHAPIGVPSLGCVASDVHPFHELETRLRDGLSRHRVETSITASLFIYGRPTPQALPAYLCADRIPSLQMALSKCDVQLVTAEVTEYLGTTAVIFDAFSLSDTVSYMPPAQVCRLYNKMLATSRDDSRFVMRQFLTRHDVPDGCRRQVKRDREVEAQLRYGDTSFLYTFMAGTLHQEPTK